MPIIFKNITSRFISQMYLHNIKLKPPEPQPVFRLMWIHRVALSKHETQTIVVLISLAKECQLYQKPTLRLLKYSVRT